MPQQSRKTKQKQLLEQQIGTFQSFFSADELFAKVKKKETNIGIATIYRFLKEMASQHKLHAYQCDGRTIYAREQRSHCHFYCEQCGKKTHFELKHLDALKKEVKGTICHIQVDVSGTCEQCSQKGLLNPSG